MVRYYELDFRFDTKEGNKYQHGSKNYLWRSFRLESSPIVHRMDAAKSPFVTPRFAHPPPTVHSSYNEPQIYLSSNEWNYSDEKLLLLEVKYATLK